MTLIKSEILFPPLENGLISKQMPEIRANRKYLHCHLFSKKFLTLGACF